MVSAFKIINILSISSYRWLKQEAEDIKVSQEPGPKLDLGFKEGQTITINIGVLLFSFSFILNFLSK